MLSLRLSAVESAVLCVQYTAAATTVATAAATAAAFVLATTAAAMTTVMAMGWDRVGTGLR